MWRWDGQSGLNHMTSVFCTHLRAWNVLYLNVLFLGSKWLRVFQAKKVYRWPQTSECILAVFPEETTVFSGTWEKQGQNYLASTDLCLPFTIHGPQECNTDKSPSAQGTEEKENRTTYTFPGKRGDPGALLTVTIFTWALQNEDGKWQARSSPLW